MPAVWSGPFGHTLVPDRHGLLARLTSNLLPHLPDMLAITPVEEAFAVAFEVTCIAMGYPVAL